jgi:hypothetical protein
MAFVRGAIVGTSPVAQEAIRQEVGRLTIELLAPRLRLHFLTPQADDGLLGAAQMALDHALAAGAQYSTGPLRILFNSA